MDREDKWAFQRTGGGIAKHFSQNGRWVLSSISENTGGYVEKMRGDGNVEREEYAGEETFFYRGGGGPVHWNMSDGPDPGGWDGRSGPPSGQDVGWASLAWKL